MEAPFTRNSWIKTWFLALAAGSLLSACASPAALDPISPDVLTERDRRLMERAAQRALERNNTGETTNWSNPASGHNGTVTPTRTYQTELGRPCRDYRMTVTTNGPTSAGHSTACRMPDGSWMDRRHAGPAGAFFEGPAYSRRPYDPDRDPYYGSPPGYPRRPPVWP
ncbi:MAG: hypothetical protein HYZ11_09465 [Candidatus Tectomicrobia bacterium]|uniref:Surface antigen domain-containing protein n=1 Tax=Tectimicrobiota bacterium TaxID=2528274 RepID=A0A932I235_UNCTE|nr:hypothetical protein [Candidatus Tectomicrobia bacterium]